MNETPDDSIAAPGPAPAEGNAQQTQPSPLHRIAQERSALPVDDPDGRRATLSATASNRRYWVRLNVSPLGWVALVEQGEGGGTSALGDVLDLGGGGCVMTLSSVPGDLLTKGKEISVSLRPGPDQLVICTGQVLDWIGLPSGVQVRIAFTSSDPLVQKQLADAAVAARIRLLQLSQEDT